MTRTLVAIALSLGLAATAFAGVGKGQHAPDFSLPSLKGPRVSLASMRGKVVVLDFWAQWCEPCKKELPELQKISQEMGGKNVVVIGVNIDKQRDNAQRLVRQLGLTFPIGLDPAGSVAGTYDLPKMPTSFVIDQRGVVRYVHAGFDGADDVAKLKSEISSLAR